MSLDATKTNIGMPVLSMQGVQHPYIACTHEKPLCVDADAGECLWIKGDNGAGKSTFLKLIAGVMPIEQGSMVLSTRFSYLGAKLGMKMQTTHAEYKRFIAALSDQHSAKDVSTIANDVFCLQTSHLPKNRELNNFSSGQQLSIRLTAALLSNRPLWILDEPTRFLDSKNEKFLWDRIKNHCDKGGVVIIASHEDVSSWIPNCKIVQL